MALTKQFSTKLQSLWNRRTANLRGVIIPPGSGKTPKFNKTIRDQIVTDLLEVASEILIKRDARQEFKEVIKKRYLKKLSGRGVGQKAERLLEWAKENLSGPIVYAFWRGSRCLYVGKGSSRTRLSNYQKSIYLSQADSVEIFCVKTAGNLGKAECLATHLFLPRDNKIKVAKKKWGRECPVCSRHDYIRDQLNHLCRIR